MQVVELLHYIYAASESLVCCVSQFERFISIRCNESSMPMLWCDGKCIFDWDFLWKGCMSIHVYYSITICTCKFAISLKMLAASVSMIVSSCCSLCRLFLCFWILLMVLSSPGPHLFLYKRYTTWRKSRATTPNMTSCQFTSGFYSNCSCKCTENS